MKYNLRKCFSVRTNIVALMGEEHTKLNYLWADLIWDLVEHGWQIHGLTGLLSPKLCLADHL